MTQPTQEQRDEFLKKRNFALSLFEEGATVESILKQIYMESLESKSDMQAEIMAGQIIESVDLLFATFDNMLDAPGLITEKLNLALSELTPEQKAETLLSASCVLENLEKLKKYGPLPTLPVKMELEKLKKRGIDEATINHLLERTVAAASSEKTAETLLEAFKNQSKEEICGRVLAEEKLENDIRTFLAVDSMIFYTMSVNGRIEGVPQSTSIFEIVSGIFMTHTLENLANSENDGSILHKVTIANICSLLLSVVIVVAVTVGVSALFTAAEFMGTAAVLIGFLCIVMFSGELIKLAHSAFYNSVIYAELNFPVVEFPLITNALRDKTKNNINSAKQVTEQQEEDNLLNYSADYSWLYDEHDNKLYVSPFDIDYPG